MNNIQNYQVNFQAKGSQKTVKTLADRFKDQKEVKKIAANFANTYHPSKKVAAELLEIDKNTTPRQIKDKVKTIFKNLNNLLNELKNMKCDCQCNENASINEGIIDIIR